MNESRMARFGAATTTDEVLAGLDLASKTALVTGGTSGLGAESARALAAYGADVVITARNAAKGATAAEEIRQATGASVRIEELELGSSASIRACAERILNRGDRIDMLILNAGVMATPFSKTDDGFEMQFGCNHLGHFLLTCLIVPVLNKGARVVSVSSAGHQISPVVFEDIQFENREYHRWASYGQAKTANVLFAVGLNKRLASRGVEAFSLHPGGIITDLGRHMTEEDISNFQARIDTGDMPMKTIPAGAATQVLAATAPELTGKGGAYLADCQICEVDDEVGSETVVRSYAIDPDAAEQLWRVSEEMVGQRFHLA